MGGCLGRGSPFLHPLTHHPTPSPRRSHQRIFANVSLRVENKCEGWVRRESRLLSGLCAAISDVRGKRLGGTDTNPNPERLEDGLGGASACGAGATA